MRINNYYIPQTLREAVSILSSTGNTKLLAGGTDLMISLRERRVTPDNLLDLGRVAELKNLYCDAQGLHVASMCTFSEIESSGLVWDHCPILAAAASQIGSPQIRNSATIGGNLANAAAAADSVPVMLATQAKAVLVSARGERTQSVEELLNSVNHTNIAQDEIIREFIIPRKGNRMAFEKIGLRNSLAISQISIALVMDLNNGIMEQVQIALGAVGAAPYLAAGISGFLEGNALNEEIVEAACQRLEILVSERLGNKPQAPFKAPYKKRLASAVLSRAIWNMKEVPVA